MFGAHKIIRTSLKKPSLVKSELSLFATWRLPPSRQPGTRTLPLSSSCTAHQECCPKLAPARIPVVPSSCIMSPLPQVIDAGPSPRRLVSLAPDWFQYVMVCFGRRLWLPLL